MLGGQYNPETNCIEFIVMFSGVYKILENRITLTDISHLADEHIKAIMFMVSKGYIDYENDRFEPDKAVTRDDFVKMLVRIFFALDKSLKTKFTDVDENSPSYAYIASAEHADILHGIDEYTFGGGLQIPKVQAIVLCANLLKEKKGYIFPENPDEFLSAYYDAADIPEWAREGVALAVREGFLEGSGMFNPNEIVTKKDVALYLNRLFAMLYEVRPEVSNLSFESVSTDEAVAKTADDKEDGDIPDAENESTEESSKPNSSIPLGVAFAGIVAVTGAGGYGLYRKSRKDKGEQK